MKQQRPRIRSPRRSSALAAAAVLAVAAATPTAVPGTAPARAGHARARDAGAAACALAPAPGASPLSEGIPTPVGHSRGTGRVDALTLMIDFPDAPGEGTARRRFREFFPQTARWFARASYGRLDYRVSAPAGRWLRMPRPFGSYGLDRGSPYEPGYHRLLTDLVRVAGPVVDFRRHDLVNVLVTPNAGPPAVRAVLSVSFAANPRAPVADGVRLANVSFVYGRQDDGTGSYPRTGFRVLPHENGHLFGLPDLYTGAGGDLAGHWDVMSEDWGPGNDLMAWHKWKLGWLRAGQVACAARRGGSAHTLSPLGRPGGTKLVVVPLSATEALTAEARTDEGNDDRVCRPGVLISRVDTRTGSGGGPVRVADATPGSPGCTREPNVHPGLSDAAHRPGQSFTAGARGERVTVRVTGRDARGGYRVEVTRGPASAGGRG
ncbi:M6 family metalloprotease domain-containing protein [Streptomyces sp. B1866]|uniref:M6 family metalloprotease domain-containing protein n=1 Tax=Streptomyces sp. B1866 TaxID=3075431 RepID=UPI0028922973|nr:M6 family metalloprotease domain-containing protein [Streptomyces sp. B1866]MDT3398503.1 M6 family metalloprotease domain-containing protein [Streptomyces sp. B1866]